MPAIVTHDTFGKNAYELIAESVGSSTDCMQAFLLGNQGPDPLFYLVADPTLSEWERMGSKLHTDKTNEVLAAMRQSLSIIPEKDEDIARAYALGFLCHYLLDSTVHPLVYAQEYAVCDAGVPGLSRKQGNAVHATIEREYDEVVLNRHLHTTLLHFSPAKEILKASNRVLKTVSTMYLYVSLVVFNEVPPAQLFTKAVKTFRTAEALFTSPTGIKRRVLVRTEETFRGVSAFGSLSMQAAPREESIFENNAKDTWVDPASGLERNECFEELFETALNRVEESAKAFLDPNFSASDAQDITKGLTFDGNPIGGAFIQVVE